MLIEMKDICYKCGKVQEYGTMKDLNEIDFDIFCDPCYKKIPDNKKELDYKRTVQDEM